jgi:hypothetical protein
MPVELATNMAREDGGLRFGVALTRCRAASTGGYTCDCERTHGCGPAIRAHDWGCKPHTGQFEATRLV